MTQNLSKPGSEEPPRDELGLERLIFFTDAIFAIAITLLVLDLQLPESLPGGNVWAALGSIQSDLIGFVVSFLVIGIYWVAHHRHFRYIKAYDGRLIWLNLFFLMSIVFMPFSTRVISSHGDQPSAVQLYALNVSVTGFLFTLSWVYAAESHRLVDPALPVKFVQYFTLRALIPSLIFLASMLLTFTGVEYLTQFSWVSILLVPPMLSRIYGYRV